MARHRGADEDEIAENPPQINQLFFGLTSPTFLYDSNKKDAAIEMNKDEVIETKKDEKDDDKKKEKPPPFPAFDTSHNLMSQATQARIHAADTIPSPEPKPKTRKGLSAAHVAALILDYKQVNPSLLRNGHPFNKYRLDIEETPLSESYINRGFSICSEGPPAPIPLSSPGKDAQTTQSPKSKYPEELAAQSSAEDGSRSAIPSDHGTETKQTVTLEDQPQVEIVTESDDQKTPTKTNGASLNYDGITIEFPDLASKTKKGPKTPPSPPPETDVQKTPTKITTHEASLGFEKIKPDSADLVSKIRKGPTTPPSRRAGMSALEVEGGFKMSTIRSSKKQTESHKMAISPTMKSQQHEWPESEAYQAFKPILEAAVRISPTKEPIKHLTGTSYLRTYINKKETKDWRYVRNLAMACIGLTTNRFIELEQEYKQVVRDDSGTQREQTVFTKIENNLQTELNNISMILRDIKEHYAGFGVADTVTFITPYIKSHESRLGNVSGSLSAVIDECVKLRKQARTNYYVGCVDQVLPFIEKLHNLVVETISMCGNIESEFYKE